jgi:hypothetical protein
MDLTPCVELLRRELAVAAEAGGGEARAVAERGHTVWGHVGDVPGYQTYSFTRAEGGRQITVSINRSLSLIGGWIPPRTL